LVWTLLIKLHVIFEHVWIHFTCHENLNLTRLRLPSFPTSRYISNSFSTSCSCSCSLSSSFSCSPYELTVNMRRGDVERQPQLDTTFPCSFLSCLYFLFYILTFNLFNISFLHSFPLQTTPSDKKGTGSLFLCITKSRFGLLLLSLLQNCFFCVFVTSPR